MAADDQSEISLLIPQATLQWRPTFVGCIHTTGAGTMPGARKRGRPRMTWMDNIKTWTGLSVEESIRMTEDRYKWRKYFHGVANTRIEDG